MKKNDKKFAKEEIGNLERYEDVTKYGEFVSSYFAWMSLEEQKNRVDKMENMTKWFMKSCENKAWYYQLIQLCNQLKHCRIQLISSNEKLE